MSKDEIVRVDLAGRSYDIVIGSGILSSAGEKISKIAPAGKIFIITDKNVKKSGHLDVLQESLRKSATSFESIILEPGEKTKSFSELEGLLNKLLSFHPDRSVTLVALGGGVIGDLTGFAASILLRGVNFIQVPTTLLSMVDSSVGGKTAVNSKYGKNLVGSFYQPKLVIADVSLLSTLPDRHIRAGYAEIVKYALLGDKEFFSTLKNASLEGDIINIIKTSCEAKARVVSEDERESGSRALLNLGHTFGHAFEAETGYSEELLHGEAVAIGMVLAFQFSERLGICPGSDVEETVNHLKKMGLPTSPLDISQTFVAEDLMKHIKHDKKVKNNNIVLILVKGIGKAFIENEVCSQEVHSFLQDILTKSGH